MKPTQILNAIVPCVALGFAAFLIQSCSNSSSSSSTEGCSADVRFGGTDVECGKTPALLTVTLNGDTTALSTYDFGRKNQSGSYDLALAINNTGGTTAKDITLSGTTYPILFKDGSYPGAGGTCSTTLEPGATCIFILTFKPQNQLPYTLVGFSATLTLEYNDGATTQSETLPVIATGDYCMTTETRVAQIVQTGYFGYSGATADSVGYGNSFTFSSDQQVSGATFMFRKFVDSDSVNSVTYSIRGDCSGKPCATALVSKTFVPANLTTTLTNYSTTFDTPLSVTKDTRYWLVARMNGMTGYLTMAESGSAQGGGTHATTTNSESSWTTTSDNSFVYKVDTCKY